MPTVIEGALRFTFSNGWLAEKYDDWSFYRNQYQSVCGGSKAVDVIAVSPRRVVWLIEIKDYRNNCRTKTIHIADEVADKVRDSLAGLVAASANANDSSEKQKAKEILANYKYRVVLHLEQNPSQYIHTRGPAGNVRGHREIAQKLRQILKAVDPHPKVVDMNDMLGLPWTVTREMKA